MKILLVASPASKYSLDYKEFAPPLGLMWIGAKLKQEGHEVKIIDFIAEGLHCESISEDSRGTLIRYGLPDSEIEKRIKDFNPHLIGVSSIHTSQHSSALNVCRIAKKIDSKILTVLGGGHVTFTYQEILENNLDVDFIILGEGEFSLTQLIKRLEDKKFQDVNGLAYRYGKEIRTYPRAIIFPLDKLPLPDLDSIDLSYYSKENSIYYCYGESTRDRWLSFHSSRGCRFMCDFCLSMNMEGTIMRPLSLLRFEEYVGKMKKSNITDLQIEDNNFLLQEDWRDKVKILKAYGIKYNLINGVSPSRLNNEVVKTLADTGCYRLFYPIESANKNSLLSVGKEQNIEVNIKQHKKNIQSLKSFGIDIITAYMIGFPGETWEDMDRTRVLAEEIFQISPEIIQSYIFHVTPFPGTRLYEQCKKENLLIEDWDRKASYNWTYRFPHIVTRANYRECLDIYQKNVSNIVNKAIKNANRSDIAEWIIGGRSWGTLNR